MDQSRKRGFDGSTDYSSKRTAVYSENGPTSRSNNSSTYNTNEIVFKMLCPPLAVGSIIGKGGSVLIQLKEMTGARIRVSQSNEFYPGTTERVVGIYGPSKESIVNVLREIVTRIFESLDNKKDGQSNTNATSSYHHDASNTKEQYEIRCLIPVGASGIIIGRGGSIIRELGERSQCHLNLGENIDPYNTKERILYIKGPAISKVITGIQAAFEQLQSEPSSTAYANTRVTYEGSTPQQPQYGASSTPYGTQPVYSQPTVAPSNYTTYGTSAVVSSYGTSSTNSAPTGYAYGNRPSQSNQAAPIPVATTTSSAPPAATAAGLPPGCTAPMFSTDGTKIILQMGIPDDYLGAIIGKQGTIIKEIMTMSGAFCQVTQKGDYLPGTNLRSLKVTGSQQQVQLALNTVLARLHGAVPKPVG